MDFLDCFTRVNEQGFVKYILKEGHRASLISQVQSKFQECYISNRDLRRLCSQLNKEKNEILSRFKLPDEGNIMSGDFGEIFCLLLVKNNLSTKGVKVYGIPKWRWKQQRNKPAPHSDGILFHIKDSKQPCPDDYMVSVESKMKSTVNKKYNPIQNSINGATDDKLGRVSKTLIWLDEKYGLEGKANLLKQLERFKKPDVYGTYKRHYKAIAIIDSALFEKELNSGWANNDQDIQVVVFSINELKDAYEQTFKSLIELA